MGKEKEIADGEEKKVAKINEEVTKKQQECERDLAKAEPALKVFIIYTVYVLVRHCVGGSKAPHRVYIL